MQKRTLVVLAVLFAGLLAYVLVVEVGKKDEREKQQAREEQVLPLQEDDVRRIHIEGDSGVIAIELRGDAVTGEWFLTEPYEAPADPAASRSLARAAATLKEQRVLEEASDELGQYGLEHPALTVTLEAEGLDSATVMAFGAETGAKDGRYLQIQGEDTIRIVPAHQFRALDKDIEDLRDKRVVRFSTGAVEHVTLVNPGGQVELVRTDGVWRLGGEALPHRAARRDVEDLLADLTTARAQRFLDADDPSLGLADSGYTILVQLEGGETITIDVARPTQEGVIVQVRGTEEAAELGAFLARPLERTVEDWRTTEVADINPWQASEVRFSYGGKSFELMQDQTGDWSLTEDGAKPGAIDAERARDVLHAIDDIHASAFLEPGAEPGPLAGKVEVVTEGQATVRFTIHREGDTWSAVTEGDPTPVRVDGSLGLFFESFLADPKGQSL